MKPAGKASGAVGTGVAWSGVGPLVGVRRARRAGGTGETYPWGGALLGQA